MTLARHKTKIVCTIGPASETPDKLEQMIRAGMDVARLNFSHGSFKDHGRRIEAIREASRKAGRTVVIMADLPGPKMRIGELEHEPVELKQGAGFTLTTRQLTGNATMASMSFPQLPSRVRPGDTLYLNDGFIVLRVEKTDATNVVCKVLAGGELRSRKGLNLPGIDLGISAFTDEDRECLEFALERKVDAVSQSFVETAQDITAVREAALALGHQPFIIAKLERAGALDQLDGILRVADGIMIARGDLGVEIPIERIALVQKEIMRRANRCGKPIITATQMLESMTTSRLPTRAESTDVANAILDGTDCVMLSGESAVGKYPLDAVRMLAKIAEATEPHQRFRPDTAYDQPKDLPEDVNPTELVALSVAASAERVSPALIIVPTRSGATPRRISRFRLPVWLVAVSSDEKTCRELQFSYGVHALREPDHPDTWNEFAQECVRSFGVKGKYVLLTEGPSRKHPEANNRMEIITLDGVGGPGSA